MIRNYFIWEGVGSWEQKKETTIELHDLWKNWNNCRDKNKPKLTISQIGCFSQIFFSFRVISVLSEVLHFDCSLFFLFSTSYPYSYKIVSSSNIINFFSNMDNMYCTTRLIFEKLNLSFIHLIESHTDRSDPIPTPFRDIFTRNC